MSGPTESDFGVLHAVVGATLRGLAHERYLFNGLPGTEDGGSLELTFDRGVVILLYLAVDGESVRAARGGLVIGEPFTSDGGDTCALERIDLGRAEGFARLLGQRVIRVEAIVDTWAHPAGVEAMSGWVLRFAGGESLAYLNLGDSSRLLLNEPPPPHADPAVRSRLVGISSKLPAGLL